MVRIRDLWANLFSETRLEGAEFTGETSAAVLGLAIALGVTNTVVGVTAASLAFVGPIKKVIEFCANHKNEELTLAEVVAIAAPLAYLKSFNYLTQSNDKLATIRKKFDLKNQSITSIQDLSLTEELAINVLRSFHESDLGNYFNNILSKILQQLGLKERECQIIPGWVAWNTNHYLKEAIAECQENQNFPLVDIYLGGQNNDNDFYQNLTNYLNSQIATKPKENVFNESFSFEDIYVSLKALPVYKNGNVREDTSPFDLETWTKETIQNSKKNGQVIFIQGGLGRGKTVFCRMLADWVRQHLHPLWTPILIRLRDIRDFPPNFKETLQTAIIENFVRDDLWLTNTNLRFVFILDGFDELIMQGRKEGGLERFIKQVGSFQEVCQNSKQHRFIVTGRQLALQGINYLPNNLERVELQPMNDDLQQQWLVKWQKVVDTDPNVARDKVEAFKNFIKANRLPKEVKEELAREPLLLYLLAAMHRDGHIKVEDLEQTENINTKIINNYAIPINTNHRTSGGFPNS